MKPLAQITLLLLCGLLAGCNLHFQDYKDFTRTVVAGSESDLSAQSINETRYVSSSFFSKREDSITDEIFIQICDDKMRFYDTIRTEVIRNLIHDSILFSGEVPNRKAVQLTLKTIDVSISNGERCYSLLYKLATKRATHAYLYTISFKDSVKTASKFIAYTGVKNN